MRVLAMRSWEGGAHCEARKCAAAWGRGVPPNHMIFLKEKKRSEGAVPSGRAEKVERPECLPRRILFPRPNKLTGEGRGYMKH